MGGAAPLVPYSVALISRGAGAFSYTYTGPPDLPAGTLCALPFQHRLELGLVLEPDVQPPAVELRSLWALKFEPPPLGPLLLNLCAASMSAPDELAGHLLFDASRAGIKLKLSVDRPETLNDALRDFAAKLSGVLTPTKQRELTKSKHWDELAAEARSGTLSLQTTVAGLPQATRGLPAWRRWYQLDQPTASLHGLREDALQPGNYLAGFDDLELKSLPHFPPPEHTSTEILTAKLTEWDSLVWPAGWDLLRHWPQLEALPLRRTRADWPALQRSGGLPALLDSASALGGKLLLIAPQVWVIQRLWPKLQPLAQRVLRFRADGGPAQASEILARLDSASGCVVLGGPAAWKLAAYARFDRIILLDPSHPQFTPERRPHLDPRLAVLLAAAAHSPLPVIELIELGLSAIDGTAAPFSLDLHEPHEPPRDGRRDTPLDTDPLPLQLRRGDLRRLVYFNRLGASRGLHCAECFAQVVCPTCGSPSLHYSAHSGAYVCPDCGFAGRELRCPRCGLSTLASLTPGLEAVTLRPGDTLVRDGRRPAPGEWQSVIGTSELLDPPAGYWPQQVTYVHAEGQVGLFSDWPAALDTALRLRALYLNPELESLHIVNSRLKEQLGETLDNEPLAQHWRTETGLRKLGNLPPYGCLFHLRLIAGRSSALDSARSALGGALRDHPHTELLRLGGSYRERGVYRSAGWLINPALTLRELQELRWQLHELGCSLTVNTLRGPWL